MASRLSRGVPFLSALVIVLWSALAPQPAAAIPAFARKYGLPCSGCHEAWPKLNVFGQTFKDNGYQLMNDRDSPIWQNPAYWPATMRITPHWHRESANRVAVDTIAGPNTAEVKTIQHGFDLSGLDILTGGTLHSNISFLLVPSLENTGDQISGSFESAWVRFDNLAKTPWLNFKMGKFELDNIISEKRGMTLSDQGGGYQLYHFIPVGSTNSFGQIGDNQLGIEILGHSKNSYTRYSAAFFSSNDGAVGVPNGNAYTGYFTASRAFDTGRLGVQRVGAYYLVGEAPTFFQHTADGGVTGVGPTGKKSFHREGVFALVYVKKLDFSLYYQHGWDNAFFGTGTPGDQPLPIEARAPTWNGGFVETHYTVHPQLIFIQRCEFVRMSRQAFTTSPSSLGNIDAYTFATRWYPIMLSRAGLALHGEYSLVRQQGVAPVTFRSLAQSSTFLGLDFDF